MRVAVSTVGFPDVDLLDLPRAVRSVGATGIAVGIGPNGPLSLGATAATVSTFLERCSQAGVTVSATYGYAGRKLLSDAAADDADQAKRCVDLAAGLGAPVCRIFAGTARGTDDVIDRFLEACRPVADHAAAAGVRLGFPTHHDLAFDPLSCRRLVEGLGRDRAGIIFTGPNLELDGIDPQIALVQMADLVLQAEVKDWKRAVGTAHPVAIGTGEATVWPLLEALAASGFDGWITLHHLRQHHPELAPLSAMVATRVGLIAAAARSR